MPHADTLIPLNQETAPVELDITIDERRAFVANPGKRSVVTDPVSALRTVARRMVPMCLEELARIAIHSPNHMAKVRAIETILDRAYGKAALTPETREAATAGQTEIKISFGDNVKQPTFEAKRPFIDVTEDGTTSISE